MEPRQARHAEAELLRRFGAGSSQEPPVQRLSLDALLLPTVPLLAPRIDAVQNEEVFLRTNALLLRNPSVFNFFDLPALSLPLPRGNGLTVGLMLVGRRGADRDLLALGAAVERELGQH